MGLEGWSAVLCERHTKVNRCLSEGRRALLNRVAGIEAGAECERLRPLLSALADGEADADDLAALRPHLRTCLTCRARLRGYRDAPARVAALLPPALAAGGASGDTPGTLRSLFESIVGATQDKAAALGERAHAAAELATGQKLAAVVASAAALAGGGAGVEHLASERGERPHEPAADTKPVAEEPHVQAVVEATPTEPPPAPVSPPPAAPPPAPDPANEFAPGTAPPAASPTAATAGAGTTFAPGGGGGTAGGGGEFGP